MTRQVALTHVGLLEETSRRRAVVARGEGMIGLPPGTPLASRAPLGEIHRSVERGRLVRLPRRNAARTARTVSGDAPTARAMSRSDASGQAASAARCAALRRRVDRANPAIAPDAHSDVAVLDPRRDPQFGTHPADGTR